MNCTVIADYHPNGILRCEYTVNDQLQWHGTYQEWHSNGQLKVLSNWVNGTINGVEHAWDKNGTLITSQLWANYFEVSVKVYYNRLPVMIYIIDVNVDITKFLADVILQLTSEGKEYDIKHL